MANYKKENFISPVQAGDDVLKIKNKQNITTYLIRDVKCTVIESGVNVIIKQDSQAKEIILDFSTAIEAKEAGVLLRTALKSIVDMLETNGMNNIFADVRTSSITPTANQTVFDLSSLNIRFLINIYINNQIIINTNNSRYTYSNSVLTWLNQPFTLDEFDTIQIQYL